MNINQAYKIMIEETLVYKVEVKNSSINLIGRMVIYPYPNKIFLSTEGNFLKYSEWFITPEEAVQKFIKSTTEKLLKQQLNFKGETK